jgi:type IV pilus assembly protein PilB
VATSNPFDVLVKDRLARMTGYRIDTYVAPEDWITRAIERFYKTGLTIDEDIENITHSGVASRGFEENQIIRLAELLIEKGQLLGASDIHVVPDANLVRVYYRIDGVLQQKYLFPISFHQSLLTRLKIMASIDISNPNIPHDGRIRHNSKIGNLDIRVSTFPTHLGETIVLRLLIYTKVVGNLDRLGFEKEDLERFLSNIKRPYGLILATGPTGSGKTTTLYSALMAINSPNVSVMTIEDPIEFAIPTIRQTAVNPKAGLTFGSALRSAMRQDPDIILVGEIRDQETAELALRAAMTGHLVLSTLHTNDAASAVNRLLDLGVSKSILASSLTMVVAQRLMRTVCSYCAIETAPDRSEIKLFEDQCIEPPKVLLKAAGCEKCGRTGYRGRTGIYEVMTIDRIQEDLIFSGAFHSKIEEAAAQSGTTLLFPQALKKVVDRITSLEEVSRVVPHA